MPSYNKKIEIPGHDASQIYEKVAADIEKFLSKGNVGHFDVERDPAAKEVRVNSKMFSATLLCRDGGVDVDGKLSLMAAPFKSKIDDGIQKWLAKSFA